MRRQNSAVNSRAEMRLAASASRTESLVQSWPFLVGFGFMAMRQAMKIIGCDFGCRQRYCGLELAQRNLIEKVEAKDTPEGSKAIAPGDLFSLRVGPSR